MQRILFSLLMTAFKQKNNRRYVNNQTIENRCKDSRHIYVIANIYSICY